MSSAQIESASGYWYGDDSKTQQGVDVLNALRQYRAAEVAMRRRTRTSMGMGETDILALRYVVAAEKAGRIVTAKQLASRLEISTPSTTALIDRLERSGHVRREPHPTDRRAVTIVPTASTHDEVRHTLGSMHERMVEVAETLDRRSAQAVIEFLTRMREAVDEVDEGHASDAVPGA
ncbi:MarR family winged helix-turn-helix transcriptional regulator [Homoserinibacter sp. YIM 151385]|uniref:MarR family winged helix-turn-helix transcriptional regulator n=1 Tax=Homoserinibacter sp. YIM 151385 TaxID=2985506 RepID=UPI0022F053B2|nr:MarR family transcriptional regulator [Homoserinibacter sp. YIM 151385]WBU37938.1 MarR family transcriptional regulator [Homoserinibacter sp. YIM 151385]